MRDAEPARRFRAPGRVNLIGEHTDYNDGLVMPAAIQFDTRVSVVPRTDRILRMRSQNLGTEREVALPPPGSGGRPPRSGDWSDYVVGVACELLDAGLALTGADLQVQGSVPIGSGLSSSASLEVASALALLAPSGGELAPMRLAQLCQRAENHFVGARCGLMDQFASVHGRAGCALYFDCRSLEHEPVPLGGAALVVCNTMVRHQVAGGEYNRRRAECEAGVQALASRRPDIRSLRDVEPADLTAARATLDPVIHRRCRHVLSENARVLAMRDALSAGRFDEAGELMRDSHESLRVDFEVSCAELDLMVTLARQVPGVYGARMTGGGFGGCTVNLVAEAAVPEMLRYVGEGYERSTGRSPEIYRCQAVDGAGPVT
ncbi:MAG: galactokinase [Steroidobacteraceae bacterium]